MDKRVIKWDSYSVDLNAFPDLHFSKIPSLLFISKFFDLSVDKIAFIQTIVFTTISLLRKYTIRKYFKDNEESD